MPDIDLEPHGHDNDDATGDWRLAAKSQPPTDWLGLFSYLAAAAIVLPIAWWAKEHHAASVGRFILSPFGY